MGAHKRNRYSAFLTAILGLWSRLCSNQSPCWTDAHFRNEIGASQGLISPKKQGNIKEKDQIAAEIQNPRDLTIAHDVSNPSERSMQWSSECLTIFQSC